MKKLFLFLLPVLMVSCKSVEQYRAGIEELSGNWDTTTKAVTDFAAQVSNERTAFTTALAGVSLDEMVAKKLTAEQKSAFETAQMGVVDAIKAYEPFQQSIGDFTKTWTEKSAEVTALKDGLASGKLEGDVAAKLADLNSTVTTATENLKTWQTTYATVKGSVETAMGNLNQVVASLTMQK